ncbi:MAG TPA: prepilin-type N-terminal cleavage/methylation domain-containing protein [Candidatus Pacearchaeota archaeon]|nr:prepilin-type N-terminal cleavage/methylation domain-containing protein [Candidatus Pacearchaeota archaeon]
MNKSFTLIEILIVIVVIGVLSAFVLVGMSSITNSANITKSKAFSSSLKDSLLTSLVSEWKFEGPTNIDGVATINDAFDSWGNNNATAISGNPIIKGASDCVSNKCIDFDSDYITLNQNLFPRSGNWTVEGWFYHKDYTYPRTFAPIGDANSYVNGNKGWEIGHAYSSSGVNIVINDGTNRIDSVLSFDNGSKPEQLLNKWTHVVIVFDRLSTKKIYGYINSKKQSSSLDISLITGDILGNTDIRIGYVVGWVMYGRIDEVRMYSDIINSDKVKENYYSGSNRLLVRDYFNAKEYSENILNLVIH